MMMRRSSSVRPFGSFQVAMSRDMLTSCGIQWLAQDERYFSQAHLYLNGTNWLTSVRPLMIRFSAMLTRPAPLSELGAAFKLRAALTEAIAASSVDVETAPSSCVKDEAGKARDRPVACGTGTGNEDVGVSLTSSSQTSIDVLSVTPNYRSVVFKNQALLDRQFRLLARTQSKPCVRQREISASRSRPGQFPTTT